MATRDAKRWHSRFRREFFFSEPILFRFSYPRGSRERRREFEKKLATRAVPLGHSFRDPSTSCKCKFNIVGSRGKFAEHSRLEGVALETRKNCRHIGVPPSRLGNERIRRPKHSWCRTRNSLYLSLHFLPLAIVFECRVTLMAVGWAIEGGKWHVREAFNSEHRRPPRQSRRRLAPFGRFFLSLARSLRSLSPALSLTKKNSTVDSPLSTLNTHSLTGALTTRSSPRPLRRSFSRTRRRPRPGAAAGERGSRRAARCGGGRRERARGHKKKQKTKKKSLFFAHLSLFLSSFGGK